MSLVSLNKNQYEVLCDFIQFLDSDEPFMFIEGFAGTGKTHLLNALHQHCYENGYSSQVTATTNKAVTVHTAMGLPSMTIFTFLGLYVSNEGKLVQGRMSAKLVQGVLFIDECSFITNTLMQYIYQGLKTNYSKVVLIGDTKQLLPPKAKALKYPPYQHAVLSQPVRQTDERLQYLASLMRESVDTLAIPKVVIDGEAIKHVSKEEFTQLILEDLGSPEWTSSQSRVLCYTNARVRHYNGLIQQKRYGTDEYVLGQEVCCLTYIRDSASFYSDSLAVVTDITHTEIEISAVNGLYSYRHPKGTATFSKDLASKYIQPLWAGTVHKAQGSTYDRVYVDLSDFKRCTNRDTLVRLLYVACTRPRTQIIFTGDVV